MAFSQGLTTFLLLLSGAMRSTAIMPSPTNPNPCCDGTGPKSPVAPLLPVGQSAPVIDVPSGFDFGGPPLPPPNFLKMRPPLLPFVGRDISARSPPSGSGVAINFGPSPLGSRPSRGGPQQNGPGGGYNVIDETKLAPAGRKSINSRVLLQGGSGRSMMRERGPPPGADDKNNLICVNGLGPGCGVPVISGDSSSGKGKKIDDKGKLPGTNLGSVSSNGQSTGANGVGGNGMDPSTICINGLGPGCGVEVIDGSASGPSGGSTGQSGSMDNNAASSGVPDMGNNVGYFVDLNGGGTGFASDSSGRAGDLGPNGGATNSGSIPDKNGMVQTGPTPVKNGAGYAPGMVKTGPTPVNNGVGPDPGMVKTGPTPVKNGAGPKAGMESLPDMNGMGPSPPDMGGIGAGPDIGGMGPGPGMDGMGTGPDMGGMGPAPDMGGNGAGYGTGGKGPGPGMGGMESAPDMSGIGSAPDMGGMGSGPGMGGIGQGPDLGGMGPAPDMGGMGSGPGMGGMGTGPDLGGMGPAPDMGGMGPGPDMGGMGSGPDMGGMGSGPSMDGMGLAPGMGGMGPGPGMNGMGPGPDVGGMGQAPDMGGLGPGLDMGGMGQAPDMGGLGPGLDMGGMGPAPDMGGLGPGLDMGGMGPAPDMVGMGPGPDMGGIGTAPDMGGIGPGPSMDGMGSASGMDGMGPGPSMNGMGQGPDLGGIGQAPDMGGMGSGPDMGGMGTGPDMGGVGSAADMGGMGPGPDVGGMGLVPDISGMGPVPDLGGMKPAGGASSAPGAGMDLRGQMSMEVEIKVPEVEPRQAMEVKTPEIEILQRPEIKTPEIKTPEIKTPEIEPRQAIEIKVPEIEPKQGVEIEGPPGFLPGGSGMPLESGIGLGLQINGIPSDPSISVGGGMSVQNGGVDLQMNGGPDNTGTSVGGGMSVQNGGVGLQMNGGPDNTGNAVGGGMSMQNGGGLDLQMNGGPDNTGNAVGGGMSVQNGGVDLQMNGGLDIQGTVFAGGMSIGGGTSNMQQMNGNPNIPSTQFGTNGSPDVPGSDFGRTPNMGGGGSNIPKNMKLGVSMDTPGFLASGLDMSNGGNANAPQSMPVPDSVNKPPSWLLDGIGGGGDGGSSGGASGQQDTQISVSNVATKPNKMDTNNAQKGSSGINIEVKKDAEVTLNINQGGSKCVCPPQTSSTASPEIIKAGASIAKVSDKNVLIAKIPTAKLRGNTIIPNVEIPNLVIEPISGDVGAPSSPDSASSEFSLDSSGTSSDVLVVAALPGDLGIPGKVNVKVATDPVTGNLVIEATPSPMTGKEPGSSGTGGSQQGPSLGAVGCINGLGPNCGVPIIDGSKTISGTDKVDDNGKGFGTDMSMSVGDIGPSTSDVSTDTYGTNADSLTLNVPGLGPGSSAARFASGLGAGVFGLSSGVGGAGPDISAGGAGPGASFGGAGPGTSPGGAGPSTSVGGAGPDTSVGGTGPGANVGGAGSGASAGGIGPGTSAAGGTGPDVSAGGAGPSTSAGGAGPGASAGGAGPGASAGPGAIAGGAGPAIGLAGIGPDSSLSALGPVVPDGIAPGGFGPLDGNVGIELSVGTGGIGPSSNLGAGAGVIELGLTAGPSGTGTGAGGSELPVDGTGIVIKKSDEDEKKKLKLTCINGVGPGCNGITGGSGASIAAGGSGGITLAGVGDVKGIADGIDLSVGAGDQLNVGLPDISGTGTVDGPKIDLGSASGVELSVDLGAVSGCVNGLGPGCGVPIIQGDTGASVSVLGGSMSGSGAGKSSTGVVATVKKEEDGDKSGKISLVIASNNASAFNNILSYSSLEQSLGAGVQKQASTIDTVDKSVQQPSKSNIATILGPSSDAGKLDAALLSKPAADKSTGSTIQKKKEEDSDGSGSSSSKTSLCINGLGPGCGVPVVSGSGDTISQPAVTGPGSGPSGPSGQPQGAVSGGQASLAPGVPDPNLTAPTNNQGGSAAVLLGLLGGDTLSAGGPSGGKPAPSSGSGLGAPVSSSSGVKDGSSPSTPGGGSASTGASKPKGTSPASSPSGVSPLATALVKPAPKVKKPNLAALCLLYLGAFIDGVGYAPYPGDCQKLVQCLYYNGKLNAVARECPLGMFWDQPLLLCRLPGDVPCFDDRCLVPRVLKYSRSGGCKSYFKCIEGISVPACCPKGYKYDDDEECKPISGIGDDVCDDDCDTPGDLDRLTSSNCPSMPDSENKYGYIVREFGGLRFRGCPDGTMYSSQLCRCQGNFNEPISSKYRKTCSPEFKMNFDDGFRDISDGGLSFEYNNIFRSNKACKFNGDGQIFIWGFTSRYLGKSFAIKLKVKPAKGAARRRPETIISNCGSHGEPSIEISIYKGRMRFKAKTTGSTKVVTASEIYKEDEWNEVTYYYNGKHFGGSCGKNSFTKIMGGNLEPRDNPLSIGSCGRSGFRGKIDDLEIFTACVPPDV